MHLMFILSGLHHEVDELYALLGCYAACGGNSLLTFQDNLSVPLQGSRRPRRITLERWDRQVVQKRQYGITTIRCERAHSLSTVVLLMKVLLAVLLLLTNPA